MEGGYARGVRTQAARQARAMVELLGHHPSIVMWCAHDAPLGDDTTGEPWSRARRSCATGAADVGQGGARPLDGARDRPQRRHPARRPAQRRAPRRPSDDCHLWFGWRHGNLAGLARRAPRAGPASAGSSRRSARSRCRDQRSGCSPSGGPTSTGTTSPSTTAWSATPFEAHVPAGRREVVRRVARRDAGVPGRAACSCRSRTCGAARVHAVRRVRGVLPRRPVAGVGFGCSTTTGSRSAATRGARRVPAGARRWSTRARATCTSSTTPARHDRRCRGRGRGRRPGAAVGAATSPPTRSCSSDASISTTQSTSRSC